jgi:hypothetical protein
LLGVLEKPTVQPKTIEDDFNNKNAKSVEMPAE